MPSRLRSLVLFLTALVCASWMATASTIVQRGEDAVRDTIRWAFTRLAPIQVPTDPPPAARRSPRSVQCPHALTRGPAWTVRTPHGPPARVSVLSCRADVRAIAVESIAPENPLHALGLRRGDWILSIDGDLPSDPFAAAVRLGDVITGAPSFVVVLGADGSHAIVRLRAPAPGRHRLASP